MEKKGDVKNDTSNDRNVGKDFMIRREENLPKLERLMGLELKESKYATWL